MRRDGFSLIEILTATVLLTAALAAIWQTWFTVNESAELLDKQSAGTTDALRIMAVVGQELRQASRSSLSPLPSNTLSYRIAEDLDGNGLVVDGAGKLELGELRTITRDYEDLNQDGLRDQQLVLIGGGEVRVLANGLLPEDGEAQDPGVWFEASGQGVQWQVQTRDATRRGRPAPSVFHQMVRPRNP